MTHTRNRSYRDGAAQQGFAPAAAEAYEGLFGYLRNVEPDLRERALHTYAAASSLRLIRFLQLFEGKLLTDEGRLLMRLFPDLPSLKRMRWAVVGLPYQHPVNGLAYGLEEVLGSSNARSAGGAKQLRVPLSAHLAATRRRSRTSIRGHSVSTRGWVVPEWLLFTTIRPLPLMLGG